uniref:Uncharacterized protein n=1 Tax=Anguilla anguilla TaxID=7936 RepID=A0A0E9UQ16_ANGAN
MRYDPCDTTKMVRHPLMPIPRTQNLPKLKTTIKKNNNKIRKTC